MKILDVWDFLINTRLATAADSGALLLGMLPWAGCLTFNTDLLQEIAPLTHMGARMPQAIWAAVAVTISAAVARGLALRARARPVRQHRKARLRAMLAMGCFFAWMVAELVIQQRPGLPALYWSLGLTLWCLVGAGRLQRLLRIEDKETSRF